MYETTGKRCASLAVSTRYVRRSDHKEEHQTTGMSAARVSIRVAAMLCCD